MAFYIQRTRNGKASYWTPKGWNREEAKGYSSYKRALNVARSLTATARGFADELTIERSELDTENLAPY